MKTARFHVFSGTGNSLYLARVIAERLGDDFRIEIAEVEAQGRGAGGSQPRTPIVRNAEDLDLFLFPVYALSVPRIMARYIARLGMAGPLTDKSRPCAAILATNGRISRNFRDGHEGRSLAQAERILSRRGWEVVHRDTFDFPQSITNIISPQNEERRKAILAIAEPRIEGTARALAEGRFSKRRCGWTIHLLGWPFGWLYRIFGRRCLAMFFMPDERCDGCGLCAKRCPARAIHMIGGRPDWSYACEGCERCINACPKGAIQTSFCAASRLCGTLCDDGCRPPQTRSRCAPRGVPALRLHPSLVYGRHGRGFLRLPPCGSRARPSFLPRAVPPPDPRLRLDAVVQEVPGAEVGPFRMNSKRNCIHKLLKEAGLK